MKLQAWFARDDKNQDGQVQMFECSSSWSDKTAEDFAQFDKNNDGVITPQEAREAEDEGVVRGSSGSSSRSYSRGSSSRTSSSRSSKDRESDTGSSSDDESSDDEVAATASKSSGEVDSRYLKHAVSYIRQYDTDKDGVLVEAEWKKMSRDYSKADKDGDGKITPAELAVALGG